MLLALLGVAHAGSVDIWGFGARSMGQGVGGVALVDGPEGVLLNPAALTRLETQELFLNYAVQRADFRAVPDVLWDTNLDGRLGTDDAPLPVEVDPDRADGVQVALGRPVGERFGLSIGAFMPVDRLLRIRTTEPALPSYFLYDNRPHRFEMSLGFGWEQLPGLSVGGSVEMLTEARYAIQVSLDVPVTGAEDGEQLGDLVGPIGMDVHEMQLDLAPSFAPIAAIHWDVGKAIPSVEGLFVSGVYRGASGLPVDIAVDLQGNFRIEDVGSLEPVVVTLLAPISIDMFDHYVPERLTLGAGWQDPRWEAYVETRRTSWDKMRVNVSQVYAGEVQTQVLRLSDPTIYDRNGYSVTLAPTWAFSTGAGLRLREVPLRGDWGQLATVLRTGFLYEPSPLVRQGVSSTFLDADRIGVTAGVGVEHGEPFGLVGGPIGWDLFFQYHLLASGTLQVDGGSPPRAGTPVDGAPVPIGGHLLAAGAQWTVDF